MVRVAYCGGARVASTRGGAVGLTTAANDAGIPTQLASSRVRRATPTVRATKDGGSSVIDRPGTLPGFDPKKSPSKRLPPNYRVLLHNDNVNRREYVVKALLKVVDGMTVDIAVNIMQEAHLSGVALVLVCSQEEAEKYVTGLRRNGLTSTLEPSGGKNGGDSDN